MKEKTRSSDACHVISLCMQTLHLTLTSLYLKISCLLTIMQQLLQIAVQEGGWPSWWPFSRLDNRQKTVKHGNDFVLFVLRLRTVIKKQPQVTFVLAKFVEFLQIGSCLKFIMYNRNFVFRKTKKQLKQNF